MLDQSVSARSAKETAALLKALAHPTRLRILRLIEEHRPCVKMIEKSLGLSQPNISQHLSLLRHLNIVESERTGNQVCYRITNPTVLKVMHVLSN
ncbi:MAG TPA: metalloregulator ArsR/SmtB family transcription factor [bacterium]